MKQIDKKDKIGFQAAVKGIVFTVKGGNFKIMGIIGAIALILSAILNLSNIEWSLIILCITIVLTAEAINTAIELICDYVNPHYDSNIGRIKDISAGAVLISSIGAAITGALIFGPYLARLL